MAEPDTISTRERRTITFEVVKEAYGWAVRRDRQMMTPCWCKALAVATRDVDGFVLRVLRQQRASPLHRLDVGLAGDGFDARGVLVGGAEIEGVGLQHRGTLESN